MLYDRETTEKLLEKIEEKFGKECTTNPRELWDEGKEKAFQKQKECLEITKREEITETDRLIVKKKLFISRQEIEKCDKCLKKSFSARDKVCLMKFSVCETCYDKQGDGR